MISISQGKKLKKQLVTSSYFNQQIASEKKHDLSFFDQCPKKLTQMNIEGKDLSREGGSGWGTHVNPWLIHVNVWQKPLQYCKVISLQIIKINEENKKRKRKRKDLSNLENLANGNLDEDLGNLVQKSHLFTKLNFREGGVVLHAFDHKISVS